MHTARFRVAVAICLLAAISRFGAAQTGQPPAPALRILVIDGENAINVVQQKTAVAPVVEVRDRNDAPVAGVAVTFFLGSDNAAFGGGLRTLTVTTNAAGLATANGLTPLATGPVQIRVEAAYQGQSATTTITQRSVMTAADAANAARAESSTGAGSAGAASVTTAAAGASGGTGTSVAAAAATAAGAGAATGGGLSGLAIGAIVGGAGAGALTAAKVGRGRDSASDDNTIHQLDTVNVSGRYAGAFLLPFNASCSNSVDFDGTFAMTVVRFSNGEVSGSATMGLIERYLVNSCSSASGGFVRAPLSFSGGVRGTPDNLRWTATLTAPPSTPAGGSYTATRTYSVEFQGSLDGHVVRGALTYGATTACTGDCSTLLPNQQTVQVPVTMQ